MQPTQRIGRLLIVAAYVALPDALTEWYTIVAGWVATIAWDFYIRRILEPST